MSSGAGGCLGWITSGTGFVMVIVVGGDAWEVSTAVEAEVKCGAHPLDQSWAAYDVSISIEI